MGRKQTNQLTPFEIIISYVLDIYYLINEDIDEYYYQLLEQALEYGMSIKDFWDSDIENFYCYANAYASKLHNQAHTQGLYNFVALSLALQNVFAKNKSEIKDYPKENYYILFKKDEEKKAKQYNNVKQSQILSTKQITKENLEEQYRLRLAQCY